MSFNGIEYFELYKSFVLENRLSISFRLLLLSENIACTQIFLLFLLNTCSIGKRNFVGSKTQFPWGYDLGSCLIPSLEIKLH